MELELAEIPLNGQLELKSDGEYRIIINNWNCCYVLNVYDENGKNIFKHTFVKKESNEKD